MTVALNGKGYEVNRKRVQRLMQLMGLEGVARLAHRRVDRTLSTSSIPIYFEI